MVRVVVGFVLLGAWVGCSEPSLLVGQDPAETAGGTDGSARAGGTDAPGGAPRLSRTVSLYTNQVRRAPDGPVENTLKCLPFALDPADDGTVEVRAIAVTPAGECACDSPVSAGERAAAEAYMASIGYCQLSNPDTPCSQYCMCEVSAATGATRDACLAGTAVPEGSQGYCYVSEDPAIGNSVLIADCAPSAKHGLNFFGVPADGLVVILANRIAEMPITEPDRHLALGSPCVPELESDPTINGFGVTEVAVNTGSPSCDSGLCLMNHFQGRVTCPFGQGEADNTADQACFVPYSDELVTVPVLAQKSQRTAKKTATCSCRCDGPGDGPFCTCPSNMKCSPLIAETGLASSDEMAGSYCVPYGSDYRPDEAGMYPYTCANTPYAREIADCGDPRPY